MVTPRVMNCKKDFLHQLTRLASSYALCRFLGGLSLSSSMIVSSELQDTISRMTVSSLLPVDSTLEFASWELLDKVSFKSVVQEKETGQNNTNLFYSVTIKKVEFIIPFHEL